MRKNSFAFCGGAFGDEGKGKIVDMYVDMLSKKGPVIVYRDNGGANAGHTVEVGDTRIALHQLPSGILTENATLVLGKGMVIHPHDLLTEIKDVETAIQGKVTGKIKLDEMATLSLDTHRAFESVLKQWESGGKGSTGRGISPAYADVLLRHPVRVRDIVPFNEKKLTKHYQLYQALIKGLGQSIEKIEVPVLDQKQKTVVVGDLATFLKRLKAAAKKLQPIVCNAVEFLESTWNDTSYSFVFEKAQGLGLDPRWGVYPDVTASDTTFDGIYFASESIIDPNDISVRAAVLKATYMSSVGSRVLPTAMHGPLAEKIREDAHEYGATTKRPRDIAYIDIPALRYFAKVGNVTHLILTHMDIVYLKEKVTICTDYTIDGKKVSYRPDQEYLDKVKPTYAEFEPWAADDLQNVTNPAKLPAAARSYIKMLEKEIGVPVLLITMGPQRRQALFMK
ncbi:MAG: adenylosuccinate synthase [Patescibacteria group bacterium]|nr:adenylosuccinate synthase [Patescibacteria group bacterium]